jgi:cellulose synthase operon protein C
MDMAQNRTMNGALTAMAVALLLTACGGDNPEALLASARDYLAKNDAKAAVIQVKNALSKSPNSAEARYLLGKALLSSGDPVGAEVELRKAMEAKYSPDQVVPLLAQALLSIGQGKKVISDFQKVELTSPEAKADLQTAIAMAQASSGQIDKATQSVNAALALKPDYAPAAIVKARLALAERDIDGALKLVESVVAKDGRNFEALKLKADILTVQGNADAALSAYRQAVEGKPDFVAAHAAIIALLLKENRLEDAGKQIEAMKKVAAKNPQTSLADAEYLYRKKEYKQAKEALQEVLKLAPQHPKALLLAGAVHFQLNSLVEAEDFLSRALKLSPGATQARHMLAVTYLRLNQPAKALAVIEPILDDAEQNSNLLSLAGEIYMQNGNVHKAEEYFSKASALDPTNASKQTKVALSHLAEGKADTALIELERIAGVDSGATADMALIAAAIKQKDFKKVAKAIDGLEKKQPNNPLVHTLRGTVLLARGDASAGRKSLEKALSISPTYFPAAASLAALDLNDKKPDDAKRRFDGILAVDPKNVQAMLALAELKARTGGSVDEVAAQISKAIQVNPNEPAPRLALIRLHFGNKDAKKAVAAAEDALTVLPDRVEFLDLLARGQQAVGNINQALATYGKVVALMPGSPQVLLRMADLNAAAKNTDAAIQNLRKALELKPDFLAAQRALIMLYVEAKNFSEAEKVIREVKRQRPGEPAGFLFEGDLAAVRKAWPDAVAAYRAGLKQVPSPDLAIKVYLALYADSNSVGAEKFAASWLADHAQDGKFRLAVAESASRRKEFAAAVRNYQVLLQAQPNNPLILNNLAWALGQLKDVRALDYAEKALKLSPNEPAIMETVGSLLSEKGDAGRAIELLLKASSLAPASNELKLSLAKAQIRAGKKAEARKILDELASLGDKYAGQSEVGALLKEIGN